MSTTPPRQPSPKVVPLHNQAHANLAFIRNTMHAATLFTGVSGKGMVLVGISALLASWLAEALTPVYPRGWALVWGADALIAGAISLYCMTVKASSQGQSLWSVNGKKLLFDFAPALLAGAVLSLLLVFTPFNWLLPAIWLLLYGAGVTTAGAHSIPLVPIMGLAFMAVGTFTGLNAVFNLGLPAWLGMAAGFGGLHIVFGTIIWRQHGD